MAGGESRKAETRQTLIDAAFQVFVQRGFARATTREIAQTAGVAEGTIYRHFTDKNMLFREVFLSVAGEMIEELQRLPARAGQADLRDNLRYLFELLGRLQDRLAPLMASMSADPQLANHFAEHLRDQHLQGFAVTAPVFMTAEYLRAEQELGRIRSDVDPAEAAAVVVALPFARGMERAVEARLPGGEEFPAPTEGVLDIVTRGLEPFPGLARR